MFRKGTGKRNAANGFGRKKYNGRTVFHADRSLAERRGQWQGVLWLAIHRTAFAAPKIRDPEITEKGNQASETTGVPIAVRYRAQLVYSEAQGSAYFKMM